MRRALAGGGGHHHHRGYSTIVAPYPWYGYGGPSTVIVEREPAAPVPATAAKADRTKWVVIGILGALAGLFVLEKIR